MKPTTPNKPAALTLLLAFVPLASLHASPVADGTACKCSGSAQLSAPTTTTTAPTTTTTAATAPTFTAHEWGTFTSVAGSNGKLLTGVQNGEEDLPSFVYAHEGIAPNYGHGIGKGWLRPLSNVTIRMETPVIYFYTEKPFSAQVDVGFKGGSISQWWPQRSAGETAPPLARDANGKLNISTTTIDFAKPYQGSIQWKIDVLPAGDDAAGRVFKFHETASWMHPRQTDSALVRTASGETEKYLFYRGLGNFEPPVTFTASADGTVKAANHGLSATGEMLVFQHQEGKARWTTVSAIAPANEAVANPETAGPLKENWRQDVYEEGAKMLTRAGLFRKEADAMMQTWWGQLLRARRHPSLLDRPLRLHRQNPAPQHHSRPRPNRPRHGRPHRNPHPRLRIPPRRRLQTRLPIRQPPAQSLGRRPLLPRLRSPRQTTRPRHHHRLENRAINPAVRARGTPVIVGCRGDECGTPSDQPDRQSCAQKTPFTAASRIQNHSRRTTTGIPADPRSRRLRSQ